MTLHPIRVLQHVIDEYRDYLQTEFRAKDPALRAALERELDSPGFLAQEPFFQAHRPFKSGKRWRELPIDARLAGVMEQRSGSDTAYIHQSEAITELLSPSARSVVVTTGTGSGKTEAFLLPVLQNAFEDSVAFKKGGLTAILVYPMNALANDQKQRMEDYLQSSGLAGAVVVEQYDRGTNQAKRQEMRANPPHILLTNYMMLEYLLVRPADREDIFANHRCRFLVLDEVHTYRGILGSNIALLIRRLKVHLAQARQDWKPNVDNGERAKRFPQLVPVGTSATIKSVSEDNLPRETIVRERDLAVQEFFGTLTGVEKPTIRVLGEELQDVQIPASAQYAPQPVRLSDAEIDPIDDDSIRRALCRLADLPESTTLIDAARNCRLLWDLNHWLIRRPMSVSQIVEQVQSDAPARSSSDTTAIQAEVEAALSLGAALPDGTPGALRLRAHRFIRGGWKFHRCINSACGKLYPKGEERCTACNHVTAPLYLCRNCGADYLRFVGDPLNEPLRPSADERDSSEYMMYEPAKFDAPAVDDDDDDDDNNSPPTPPPPRRGRAQVPRQMKQQPILDGSFDTSALRFSSSPLDYPLQVTFAPARNRCLCCGGTAGSRNVVTPVALGTSAAVKVVGEGLVETLAQANRDKPGHDGKERLLVFSDSRQDAAHQARFIIFAGRYDRMRRRLLKLLEQHESLTVQRTVELLGQAGVEKNDNPHVKPGFLHGEELESVRIWEEVPLLDDLSVNAGYRATVLNLGVVGLEYAGLTSFVDQHGTSVASRLNVSLDNLKYICRVILDEMRTRGALSREILRHHPQHPAYPRHFLSAEWERMIKQPRGYALSPQGEVEPWIDSSLVPSGITHRNFWRRTGAGGRSPSIQRILEHLLKRLGGLDPAHSDDLVELMKFLKEGRFIIATELSGYKQKYNLLQVNEKAISLYVPQPTKCMRCDVCSDVRCGAVLHAPCPRCHGHMTRLSEGDIESNRNVRRLRNNDAVPLNAGEHTAQITSDVRLQLEEDFKAGIKQSPVNLLACSPTLEMGIDVGGLDAVVLRNIPPRPDNYAQRGGRAGRRSRVGLVLGYARSTPHDQYFFDKPREMIAGEVPAPVVSLRNRDVIIRHLYAVVFGAAEPGIAGRMVDYVGPKGQIQEEAVTELIEAVRAKKEHAISIAIAAWGVDVLATAELDAQRLAEYLDQLPDKIRHVVNCTAKQVIDLRQALEFYHDSLQRKYAGTRAGELVARLLGIPTESRGQQAENADDRSAGYPLRRFAEFGLLPGYEFPSEPASLRLLGDEHEEDPLSVTRRFGIGQFQPDAHVYARRRRWKVIGLDTASPWNPRGDTPTWPFRICAGCQLRFSADHNACPRCQAIAPGTAISGFDFAGFLAKRDERPILDEEERFAVKNLVTLYPQWDSGAARRWTVGPGWSLRFSRNEQVRWVNEGPRPNGSDIRNNVTLLHNAAKGYSLCPSCGHMLDTPTTAPSAVVGRRNAAGRTGQAATNGHSESCPHRGTTVQPLAITTANEVEVLRLLIPLQLNCRLEDYESWGLSLGYSLAEGMRHHFLLDPAELDFVLEGPWKCTITDKKHSLLSLAFIDPSLGGSGYLERLAEQFHLVATRTLEHLQHQDCQTACYRCLKSYHNQRFHNQLHWPQVVPALEQLADEAPTQRSLQTGDLHDPQPWLDAYAQGRGSPLELKFWNLFQQYGFHPQKQVPVAPGSDQRPISVADFALPEKRLAIYIDGAAFHTGNNLRRDRFIRERLRNGLPPWRVVELRAADLARGEDLVRELRSMSPLGFDG